jgi:ABC-type Fe3+ transport system permease subunit
MSRVAEVLVHAVTGISLAWGVLPNGSEPMGIGAQTTLALVRAVLVATLAIIASGPMSRWLSTRQGRSRILAWALLIAPFFTPSLLISYGMVRFAIALIVSAWGHEALYVGVLGLKLFPVAVVIRVLLPPPLSAEGRYAYALVAPASSRSRLGFRLRAAGPAPWIAGALVFLLAFADFELASLWSVKTWTMAVFDAQIGGLALTETLRLAAFPFCLQLFVLGALVFTRKDWAGNQSGSGFQPLFEKNKQSDPARSFLRPIPWLYLAISSAVVALIPLVIVVVQAIPGVPRLFENFVLGRELGASLLFAVGAAAAASALVAFTRKSRIPAFFLAAPGLFGALTISLIILALFQVPPLRELYDTPIPLILALTILLLPLAFLLGTLWLRPSAGLHIARQIPSRRLIWELQTRPRAIACAILFCWAWFDFTASSILAPTGFTPVFVRLHNLAHYGQTAVLSAMMIAAFATPVAVLLLTGTALHLYARGHGR